MHCPSTVRRSLELCKDLKVAWRTLAVRARVAAEETSIPKLFWFPHMPAQNAGIYGAPEICFVRSADQNREAARRGNSAGKGSPRSSFARRFPIVFSTKLMFWRWMTHLRRAIWNAALHDAVLVAKAASYSAIVSVFPAMLVLAALVAVLPGADSLRHWIQIALADVLPEGATHLLGGYFEAHAKTTIAALTTASVVSFFAASGVVASLMEGFRRAYRVPRAAWKFQQQRIVAFALVPLTLVPLALAAALVIFGRILAHQVAAHLAHEVTAAVLFFWLLIRWSIALLTSVAMLTVLYHVSIPGSRRWKQSVPGAGLATALWFPSTLLFGWYVTRYADYAAVYGSLGAGIALLVWLYIVCVAVLIGAEFNADIYPRRRETDAVFP
jgi:membrane protein